ncbi:MAG: hypothetical protein AAF488_12235, partial [Planctomycetota bacterium]
VRFDGLPAVVVGLPDGRGVGAPDDHVALWFGESGGTRASEGSRGASVGRGREVVAPEAWTVPIDLCRACEPPTIRH